MSSTKHADIEPFCRDFYQALGALDLAPDDPRYVPLFERTELSSTDPVRSLLSGIVWSGSQSVQLLSGFRGTGKSTALRRLERELVERGDLVVRCDMEDYLNMSAPVDVSDFLVSMAGAWSDALRAPDLLGDDLGQSWWERLADFATRTRSAEVTELLVGVDGVGLKAALKADPTFKERLQKHMQGRLGALVADVRAFMTASVKRLRARHGDDVGVVLLLDSVEHLRGTSRNADQVEASLENLFGAHADKLRFQSMHVVITVAPWLKIRVPGLEGHFDGGELLPCIKVRDRQGEPSRPGLDALAEVLSRRGDWQRLLGTRAAVDRLILASGGYLRDLFRLTRAALIHADQRGRLPITEDDLDLALADIRDDYLPIAGEDAAWLSHVADWHQAALPHANELKTLSRFFDTHLVLCYRNGSEWYDVHPLIEDRVRQQAARMEPAEESPVEPA